MLNSRQRAQLRGLANRAETILYIGKSGVGEQVIKQAADALEARELIKAKVLECAPLDSRDAANQVADATGSDVVQVIGNKFILYRRSDNEKNRSIVLVK